MIHLSATDKILYDLKPYRPRRACFMGEVVRLSDGRVGLVAEDTPAHGEGQVFVWGPLLFDIGYDVVCNEGDKVYIDLKTQRLSPVKRRGHVLLGEAIIRCEPGDDFMLIQINSSKS